MASEPTIAFRPVSASALLKECDACGAAVPENVRARAKHRQWHEDLERMAREPARAMDRIGLTPPK